MKKLLAFLSAAALCLTALPVTSFAEDYRAEVEEPVAIPGWLPQSFEEALEFRNTYGAVHIADGLVGVVFREYPGSDTSYIVGSSSVSDEDDAIDLIQPVPEIAHYTLSDSMAQYQYEVVVFSPSADSHFGVYLSRLYNNVPYTDASYEFEVDADGNVTQTDLHGWLPDCITEYRAYTEEHGAASVHENYIVYCTEVNYSTGATVNFSQSGTAEIQEVLTSGCTQEVVMDLPGSTSYQVTLYEAVSDGTVDVSWKIGREWDLEHSLVSETEKTFEISENGSVIRDTENALPSPYIAGDVDRDGSLTVTDAVALQKWLLCVPGASLADTSAGDMNGDGALDVFDLALMKRALLASPTLVPLLLCEGSRIGVNPETGWYDTPYTRTITQADLADHPDILELIETVASKADTLQAFQMQDWGWAVEDYGEDYLYLPLPGTRFLLAKFGGETAWLDDEDVKNLVSHLIVEGYFGDVYLAKQYFMNQLLDDAEDSEENRAAAEQIAANALARLQDGTLTLDTEINSSNAADLLDTETAALFSENNAFAVMSFVDAHTVHLMLNAGLLDCYGYLVTDGTVGYAVGDEVTVPGQGYDGSLVRIDAAEENLYHFYAGT